MVVVLGHIDHGKTSLLDKIRQTNVAEGESRGITQHIGAYQIKHQEKLITFIDTPGHAAFSEMRSRGAKVADLAILVVAADEGFKLQTKESLEHVKQSKIPYLVAVNKIDLPNIDIKRIEKELAQNGIEVESEGGEIVVMPVSAKNGQGVKDLLEMILLLSEMNKIEGDPQGKLKAVVIESKMDKTRGALATLLVLNGTLSLGDEVKVGLMGAKIKAMFNENGQKLAKAGPSQPVEILGFKQVPPIGSQVERGVIEEEIVLREKTGFEKDSSFTKDLEEERLKIILKTDVSGTKEAILAILPENVVVISSGVGEISDSDILLADTTGSLLVGFQVKVSGGIKKLAEAEEVEVKNYQTIYELQEEIEERALKAMEPTIDEEVLGQAEIIAEFESKNQKIAGCRVSEGRITKKDQLHLKRGQEVLGETRIKSIKQGKENINRAEKGQELGIILDPALDFEIGDVLVSYRSTKKGSHG